jgi:hypothetical protein
MGAPGRDMYQLKMQEGEEGSSCSIRIQYLEIHNEEIKDLLHPDIPAKVLLCSASAFCLEVS